MTRPVPATFPPSTGPLPSTDRGVLPGALLALCVAVASGCSTVEGALSGDKVDYRSSPTRAQPLDVPPDLTQLSRDNRFQPPSSGVVAASTFQGGAGAVPGAPAVATATAPGVRSAATPATATAATPVVAPASVGGVRLERVGDQRWLVSAATPEQLWPQLQAFWRDAGFTLEVDEAAAGVMETNWAENRAKLPQDAIRRTLGRLVEGFYSTGERDRFRTRLERTAAGTEIFVSHRGLEEVYTDSQRTSTAWTARPRDTDLEAVFLARLMTRLGTPAGAAPAPQVATAATPAAPASPARARVLEGQPGAALQVDDTFDRAWRRVGLALDRTGYTVEDRDRTQGLYFIRVVPAKAPTDGGFLSRLFGGDTKEPSPARLRVAVKGDANASVVSIQNAQGAADGSDTAQRIVSLLVDDLK